MPVAVPGSGAGAPVTSCPALTVSRLPSAPSSLSRAAREDADTPSTATAAPMPMATPSPDSAARHARARSDPAPARTVSRGRSRDRGTVAVTGAVPGR